MCSRKQVKGHDTNHGFKHIENKRQIATAAYLAAPEPSPLVDIAFINVAILLVTVQKGSSAYHHQ